MYSFARKALAALLGAFVPAVLVASESDYAFRVWDVRHGLSQNTVHAIVQTADGYLWLGTDRGLSRFDGVRFHNFDDRNLPGLPRGGVAHLHVDHAARLWIITQVGQIGWLEQGRFRSLPWPDGQTPRPVWSVTEQDGKLLLGLFDGALLGMEQARLKVEEALPPLDGAEPLSVWVSAESRVWAGTVKGLFRLDEGKWQGVLTDEDIEFAFPPQRSTPLFADGEEGVWVAAGRRLRQYREGVSVEERPVPWGTPHATRVLLEDRSHTLWVGAEGAGLHAYEPEGVATFTVENGLPSNHILALYEDREGNLWAGTDGAGLVRIRERHFSPFEPGEALLDVPINSLVEDSTHDLWIATAGNGVIHWDGHRFLQVEDFEVTDIRSVLVDPAGHAWIGGEGIGIWKVIPHGEDTVTGFTHEIVGGLSGTNVRCLLRDEEGDLWIGLDDGLVVLDGEEVRHLTEWLGMRHEGVTALAESGPDMWVATTEGLYVIEPDRHRRVLEEPVYSLVAGRDQRVWGGLVGGLVCLHGDEVTMVSTERDFPDITLRSLALDGKGNLWGGSERGVFRCSEKDLEAILEGELERLPSMVYDEEDGLASLECSGYQPGLFVSKNGPLYIPTRRGLFRSRPGSGERETAPPIPVIEDVRIDSEEVWNGMVEPSQKALVVVPPGPRLIWMSYTAIHLRAPEKVRFRYRLRGFRDDWTEMGGRRLLEFQGLPHGRYDLELATATHRGDWGETPARLTLVVRPYAWQTWWFRTLVAVFLLGLGAWMAQRVAASRLRRQQFALEKVEAVAKERSRIAEDMHDDLGARLTQIALIGEMAHQSAPKERIHDMTVTAREAAAAMDELVWAVNPKNDRLNRLASYLSGYAEEFCESVGLVCQLNVSVDLPEHEISGRLRHDLFLSVKEALNNVAKHAAANRVGFWLTFEDGVLRLRLEDDGVGFDLDGERNVSSNGLEHLDSRLRGLDGEVRFRSAPGEGTAIEMRVPIP